MKFLPLLHLKALGRKCGQLLDNRFAPIGLTDTKVKILFALAHHSGLTAKDLLPWTEVEPASLTALLQGLERDGLIAREPHPTDRRAVVLSITEAGREAQRQARDILHTASHDLFAPFTPEQSEEFERLCGLLFARLDELGVGCRPR